MDNDILASRKKRLISEFFGMCAAFNIDNCSIDDLMNELSSDNEESRKESDKVITKTYLN